MVKAASGDAPNDGIMSDDLVCSRCGSHLEPNGTGRYCSGCEGPGVQKTVRIHVVLGWILWASLVTAMVVGGAVVTLLCGEMLAGAAVVAFTAFWLVSPLAALFLFAVFERFGPAGVALGLRNGLCLHFILAVIAFAALAIAIMVSG